MTDDNGTDVVAVCRGWLHSDDIRRVEAALSLDECWLYEDKGELRSHLSAVGSRWPQLLPRIQQILGSYDDQFGH
ncbi:hypothetical protein [Actinoplanes solisilvae]|uniref:hypothetical protein n=1 Tax=Actinoplanes solisilvae TaxID=2486853 RepID=UPI000FD8F1DF|nr:hypothetical protein [Actinoplanes solisilvae]